MYSLSGNPWCRCVCVFIETDLEKCDMISIAHYWILWNEWVPSEWESIWPQSINYYLWSKKKQKETLLSLRNKSIIKMFLTSNRCIWMKTSIYNIAFSSGKSHFVWIRSEISTDQAPFPWEKFMRIIRVVLVEQSVGCNLLVEQVM